MKIDVPQLIADLEEAGLSDIEIALRCHVRRTALYAWRSGEKGPSFSAGLELLAVHLHFCPNLSPLRKLLELQPRVAEPDSETPPSSKEQSHGHTEIPGRSVTSRAL